MMKKKVLVSGAGGFLGSNLCYLLSELDFDIVCLDISKLKLESLKKKLNKYIWPTTYPTSSISIKRSFVKKFFENNILENYPLLEIDFRITSLSKMIYKNYLVTDLNLTVYRIVSDGIMSKIKKFSSNWWKKRLQAHYFIFDAYEKNEIQYKKNYDFYITKAIVYLLNHKTI